MSRLYKRYNVLHLKLTNFNETIVKCGFPVKTLDKYLQLLKNYNYKISIIDNISKSPLILKIILQILLCKIY